MAETTTLSKFIDMLNEEKKEFANGLCITGRQQRGKSRLANLLAFGTFPAFDYNRHYLGNPKTYESIIALRKSEDESTMWFDEAEKILSAEKHMSDEQWMLQQTYNQDAKHHRLSVFCTPDFLRIDPRWRRTHISLWIYIAKKGLAVVFRNRDLQSVEDSWGLREMGGYETSLKASEETIEKKLQIYMKNPSFLYSFTFPDWDTKEQKEEYMHFKQISEDNFNEEIELKLKKHQAQKNPFFMKAQVGLGRLASHLNVNLDVSFSELGKICGYSTEAMREMSLNFEEATLNNPAEMKDISSIYFGEDYYAKIRSRQDGIKKL